MTRTTQALFFFFCVLVSITSCHRDTRGTNIIITSNPGNNAWWLAYAISDPATTKVELKDAGAYASWKSLESTSWGYWVFSTIGQAVTFPVSFRLSAGNAQVTILNVFSTPAPGQVVDTKVTYSSGTPAPNGPTLAPSTQAPSRPTVTPSTPSPPQRPTTPPPSTPTPTRTPTSAPPSTPSPTSKPTSPPSNPTTAPSKAPTTAPTTPTSTPGKSPITLGSNPFSTTQHYVNPHYTEEVDISIAANPSLSAKLAKVKAFPSAFWIDKMSVIPQLSTILTQARQQGATSSKPIMAAIVIYDLPARDCAAYASNGEIQCADADCVNGINTYKTNYIDKIADILKSFTDITIVAIIEPDSLPNLATNLAVAKCVTAQKAYKAGVAYAVSKLSTMNNIHMYIDAAHGGWLGWDTARTAAVNIFAEVLTTAGGANKIRGFATNVANYQPLGSMFDTADPCNLAPQYNFATNEVKYVGLLETSLVARGMTGMRYIIDTGRNGVINARTDCSNWCNINRAGLGVPPTSSTAASGLAIIDAYFWVKPPGESDGTSDSTAARYDIHCGSSDSVTPAPEAGNWFSSYFVMLANNANPSL